MYIYPTKMVTWLETVSHASLKMLVGVGAYVRDHWRELQHVAAVIGTVLYTSISPRYWTRSARTLFARQVMTVGVEALGFVCAVAVFVGISVVVQLSSWTGKAGQSEMLGPLLVAVVARELGPVLINLVVIVRSGSAMTTELGVLKINREVDVGSPLPSDGRVARGEGALPPHENDPFLKLVVPRVLGMALSTFCLMIVFILVAFASGYLFAAWMGKGSRDLLLFADAVSLALHPKDALSIFAKGVLPALFASAACCIGGLGVGISVNEIPLATQRALTRSIAGLFVISAIVSLLTYL